MKTREVYVIYDERRKRYLARVTAFDPVTGKRTDIKRYKKTKTEALKEKRELLNKLEKDGAESFAGDRTRFTYLARKFREEKLRESGISPDRVLSCIADLFGER